MVDPNRKINRLTEKDIEFLDECEEEFKNRYTNDDEEFVNHCKKEIPLPPIVDPWNKGKQNYDGRGGGGGGYRNNQRNRYNHHHRGNSYNYNRRGGGGRNFNRHGPYNRSDGQSSGSQRF